MHQRRLFLIFFEVIETIKLQAVKPLGLMNFILSCLHADAEVLVFSTKIVFLLNLLNHKQLIHLKLLHYYFI